MAKTQIMWTSAAILTRVQEEESTAFLERTAVDKQNLGEKKKTAFIRKMECSQGKSASRMTSEERSEAVRDMFFTLR